jgi:hypothetical protein
MADDSIIEYGDLIGDDGTFDDISKHIKQLEKELKDLAKETSKAFKSIKPNDLEGLQKFEKSVKEIEVAERNLIKTEKALQTAKKKTIDLTNEELIQREKEKIAQRERVQRAKQLAIIQKEEKDNIASIRAQLSLATLEWKKFTAEEIKTTKAGQKAFNTKKQLTAQLKKLEKATGDHRREVGNYALSLNRLDKVGKKVRKTLIGLFVGRNIISGIQRIGGAFKGLVDDFRGSNEIIGGVGKSFDKITGALQFAGVKILEFLAPAIEKVANLLSKLPAFFAGIGAAAADFATTTGNAFKRLGLQITILAENFNKINPLDDRTTAQIEANIQRIKNRQTDLANETVGVRKAFKDAYDAVIKEQEEFVNKQEAADQAAADKKARQDAIRRKKELDAIKAAEQKKLEVKLQAIISLQKQIEQLEAQNIKDSEDRARRLEELRFENEIALREAQFAELEKFFEGQAGKLAKLKNLENQKAEAQLIAHEENMLEIRKDFAIQTQDIEAIDVRKDALKQQEELLNEEVQLVEEANVKKKESNDELIQGVAQSAEKVGALIVDLYEKQADLAANNVNEQEENLNRARDRAAKGLSANLAFEEQELAKRQLEQQRKQKEAEQAAKILALFNLVSAYAQSGDKNALSRGLVDFALLTTLSAGLGFEEGGYTGDNGTSEVAGVVHGKEFVVTAKDTARFGLTGKTGGEFGDAMGDYFNPQSPIDINPYQAQKEAFKQEVNVSSTANSEMVRELRAIKSHLAKQPNIGIAIEEVYENVYTMIKRESKQTVTKISKKFLRSK